MKKVIISSFLLILYIAATFELSFAHGDPWKELGVIKPKVVKEVADFTLLNLNGEEVEISSFRNKVVFLNFWATWCGPCKKEMPAMEKLYRKYKERGFVILGIDYMEKRDKAANFMKEMNLTFPTLLDPKGSVAKLFNVYAIPSSFLIDKKGMVRGFAYGAREWDNHGAMEIIEQLLGEI